MLSFDRKEFSRKVSSYRDQFQLSLEEMASRTGINILRLKALENCEQDPTGDEILIFADLFMCDYKFFISNEKLAPFDQTEKLFRRLGTGFSSADRWAVQEVLYLAEVEAELVKALGRQFRKFRPNIGGGSYYKKHGLDAAAQLREFLGLRPNQPVDDIFSVPRSLGVHVFRRKLRDSNISGLAISHPVAGPCILVNYAEDVFRQRFTAAHEFGHVVFDLESDGGFNVSLVQDRVDLKEVRANAFASELLLPKALLEQIPGSSQWDAPKIRQWAVKLKVSTQFLGVALRSADLITEPVAELFRSTKVPQAEKSDPEIQPGLSPKAKLRKQTLLQLGLSGSYVDLCFDAYSCGAISAGRLGEILLQSSHGGLVEFCGIYGHQLKYEL